MRVGVFVLRKAIRRTKPCSTQESRLLRSILESVPKVWFGVPFVMQDLSLLARMRAVVLSGVLQTGSLATIKLKQYRSSLISAMKYPFVLGRTRQSRASGRENNGAPQYHTRMSAYTCGTAILATRGSSGRASRVGSRTFAEVKHGLARVSWSNPDSGRGATVCPQRLPINNPLCPCFGRGPVRAH